MADQSAERSSERSILIDTADRVRTLTFNRPEARNALTMAMRRELVQLVGAADLAPDVEVIVLTGSDPAFCAGVDLKEFRARTPEQRAAEPLPPNPGVALRAVKKPLICAVNGVCVTGGLELALNCDFIVASDQARFADLHARFGLVPAWGLSALLPLAIGVRLARELSLTGRFVDAAEALRVGLVNHVVHHAELMPFTRQLAAQVIGGDRRSNHAILELYAKGEGRSLAERLAFEAETVAGWAAGGGGTAVDRPGKL